jgi:hypothetical protein
MACLACAGLAGCAPSGNREAPDASTTAQAQPQIQTPTDPRVRLGALPPRSMMHSRPLHLDPNVPSMPAYSDTTAYSRGGNHGHGNGGGGTDSGTPTDASTSEGGTQDAGSAMDSSVGSDGGGGSDSGGITDGSVGGDSGGMQDAGSTMDSSVGSDGGGGSDSGTTTDGGTTAGIQLRARILVLSADGTEPELSAIRQVLDYVGTPYDVFIATQRSDLTPGQLASGTLGYYQAVFLTTGQLTTQSSGQSVSALSATEWQNLWSYEAAFGVREISWYTYPSADYGYSTASITAVDTSSAAYQAHWTAQGAALFPSVNASQPVVIQNAWTYLAAPAPDATPLLVDNAGRALGVVRAVPDGREILSLTFDGAGYLTHSMQLSYGLLNWATRGLFLGERHTFASPQIDDLLIDDDIWGSNTTFRMSGTDLATGHQWQLGRQAQPVTAGFELAFAFNGSGASGYSPDTLTPEVVALRDQFHWINHTYTHENLDRVSYSTAYGEIQNNNLEADSLGLVGYVRTTLVTPDVSGLTTLNAMQAAYDTGVRYVVSDTSVSGQDNPTPDTGIVNSQLAAILEVPRRPTNLYYNVSTPAEWTSEYNSIYHSYWGRDLTYAEILDVEGQMLVNYMLRGEDDPWMFHQPNLRAYDGTHSLLSDLLDLALSRYGNLLTVPIVSPTFQDVGQRMRDRAAYNAAGVSAVITPGQSITISVVSGATVPVTGLASTGAEQYAGQSITHVTLGAGQSATYPLQ